MTSWAASLSTRHRRQSAVETWFAQAPVRATAYSLPRASALGMNIQENTAPIGATAMLAGFAAAAPTGACVNQVSTALCRRCRVESGAAQLGFAQK